MDNSYLRSLYLSGLTLRQIGAQVGLSDFTVRYHMRKNENYYQMITRTLISRITHARTKRRLKHSIAMLRRHRPELYAELVERGRPKACQECAGAIQATLKRSLWSWECAHCGARDMRKAESIAVLLRNNGSKAPSSST